VVKPIQQGRITMKNRCLTLFGSILALFCFSASTQAEDLVFSGTVVGVSPDSGTMILSNGPDTKITLTGVHEARIRAVDGRLVRLSNLRPGMQVSVSYLQQGRQWVVSRILIPAEAQPEVLPNIADPRFRSLFDGDITTNPGSKAAVDHDITTKPPRSANRDGDITTKSDK
jgi:hypothetical protein